jgi:hypothetical protein
MSKKNIDAKEIIDKIKNEENVEYDCIELKGELNLKQVNIAKDSNGRKIIKSYIKITNSQIENETCFGEAVFQESINFSGTKFNGAVNFQGSQFERNVFFRESEFYENVEFKGTHFKRDVDFTGSKFEKYVYFSWPLAKINEKDYKDSYMELLTKFNGDLLLDHSKIHFMYLDVEFDTDAKISLEYTDLNCIFVHWRKIKNHIKYDKDGSTYLALVKNYNNLEWFEDADSCYYQYRTRRGKKLKWKSEFINKLFDSTAWMAYGYGIHPEHPLIISVILLAVSSLILYKGGQEQSLLNATYLSLTIFTGYPNAGLLTGNYIILGYTLRISGWLLMGCFLVSLAKKTLR